MLVRSTIRKLRFPNVGAVRPSELDGELVGSLGDSRACGAVISAINHQRGVLKPGWTPGRALLFELIPVGAIVGPLLPQLLLLDARKLALDCQLHHRRVQLDQGRLHLLRVFFIGDEVVKIENRKVCIPFTTAAAATRLAPCGENTARHVVLELVPRSNVFLGERTESIGLIEDVFIFLNLVEPWRKHLIF